MPVLIDRAFVRLSEGLVHLRKIEAQSDDCPPLFMLHLSPLSSVQMEPLMQAMHAQGYQGALIAPDTLGNGDSAPPALEQPEIDYFADSLKRLCGAMGYDKINILGVHTGARIACEFAAAYPERTAHAVIVGITEYDAELRDTILAHYAPQVEADEYGRQFIWAFNFMRDQAFHFPYFMRDAEHRLATVMPSPEKLHDMTMDVLRSLKTYQKPYLAAFRYPARSRFAAITVPTILVNTDHTLPNLRAAATEMAALNPHAKIVETANGDIGLAEAVQTFLAE
jgi:pimeloyl-ACP methyl ester carboxylesterase